MAYELLDGYGEADLGEWFEDRPKAFHLRRRLNAKEQAVVGEALDIRNDPGAFVRWVRIREYIPWQFWEMAYEEVPALRVPQ